MTEPDLNVVRYIASRIPRAPVQLPESHLHLHMHSGSGHSDATSLPPVRGRRAIKKAQAERLGAHTDAKGEAPSTVSAAKPKGYEGPLAPGITRGKRVAQKNLPTLSGNGPAYNGPSVNLPASGMSRGLVDHLDSVLPQHVIDETSSAIQEGLERGGRAVARGFKGMRGGRNSPPAAEPGVSRGLKSQPGESSARPDVKVAGNGNGVPVGDESFGFQSAHTPTPADLTDFDTRAPESHGSTLEGQVVPKPSPFADPNAPSWGGHQLNNEARAYHFDTSSTVHVPRQPRTARTLQTEMPGRTFSMPGQRSLGPSSTPSALSGRARSSSGPQAGFTDTPAGVFPTRSTPPATQSPVESLNSSLNQMQHSARRTAGLPLQGQTRL